MKGPAQVSRPNFTLRGLRGLIANSRYPIPVPNIRGRIRDTDDGRILCIRFRVVLASLAALLLLLGPQFAKAQDFPTRPVRIVVAFPPGGPTDFVGRLVADKMTKLLGQRVYIDNKPGANGTLGGGDVAKSDPDGYSLFLTTSGAVTVSPHMMAKMPFDTFRDFAPVALVTTVNEVLVVSPKLGVKNVKELVELAKKKPGGVTFASTGVGSPPHLVQLLLDAAAGVKFLHVPYRGAAPALTDMLGGQVQVVALDIPVVLSIQAGTLLPIGIAATSATRFSKRTDARRTGLCQHRRRELVCAAGAGEDAEGCDRQAQQGGGRRARRPGLHDKLVKTGATPVGGTPEALALS